MRARIAGRRGLRQGGGRSVGGAVEGQRRADRSDQRRRSLARAAAADSEDEAGRRDASRSGRRGFQILKLETLKPAAPQPFESVRDLVADKVHDARQQAEVRKFLARVRGQALIEWKNDELKKLYEKQVAQDATPPHG